jgi:hypothetical protein
MPFVQVRDPWNDCLTHMMQIMLHMDDFLLFAYNRSRVFSNYDLYCNPKRT